MKNLYFSKALFKKMNAMKSFSLCVVEAAAGYGKTTLVHKALEEVDASSIRWLTGIESIKDDSFDWFIEQLAFVDKDSAKQLKELGVINRNNAYIASEILRNIKVYKEIFLVIDNFQYMFQNWQPQILRTLADCRNSGLHIIFISQHFNQLNVILNNISYHLCHIKNKDFLLSKDDIVDFSRQMNVEITYAQVLMISEKTQGWAVAVFLYLKNIKECRNTLLLDDINQLLYEFFWKRLTKDKKQLLLRLCVFEQFKKETMKEVIPNFDQIFELLHELLMRIPLLAYNPLNGLYVFHEILLKFMQVQIVYETNDFHNEVYHKGGCYFRDHTHSKEAINLFYKANDYEGILQCELVAMLSSEFDGVSYKEIACEVLEKCPMPIKEYYPISVLRLCYCLYANTSFTLFEKHMNQLHDVIIKKYDAQMLGEWYLMAAFLHFPCLQKMKEYYLEAKKVMSYPSCVFTYKEPIFFGSTSMWFLFYTKQGKMMETADELDDVMQIYNSLTNGHGAGVAELYRGEAYSVQGRFNESYLQIYKAEMLAEHSNNVSVIYGIALLTGINAIYQADMIALQKVIEYLESKEQVYSFLFQNALNTNMIETVKGYLLALMMRPNDSAIWMQSEADKLTDLTYTNFIAKMCRITDMVLKKEYHRAIASVEATLKMNHKIISLPSRNIMYVGLSLCYLATNHLLKANEYLAKSLSIIGEDKNYAFISSLKKYFYILFLTPSISHKFENTIREINDFKLQYKEIDKIHIFSNIQTHKKLIDELTKREKEIADLVVKGLRNKEIALQLHVSENTVKTHLKTIFKKMNVDRRSYLIELLK